MKNPNNTAAENDIDEYKQNIDNLENPKSAKGEKTELQLLDEAQKDIGLRLEDIKSLRQEFLDENKPKFRNKNPMKV